MYDIEDYLDIAQSATLEAGKLIMEAFRAGEFEKGVKEYNLPVTRADKDSHTIITSHLKRTGLPVLSEEGTQVDFYERQNWPLYWLIDPLDGTEEFIKGKDEFTINIALMQNNFPACGVIYVPVRNILYSGSPKTGVYKNTNGKIDRLPSLPERVRFTDLLKKELVRVVASRSYMTPETEKFIGRFAHVNIKTLGSSLKFILLLENQADIYPRMGRTMEWDTAAAHAILNATNRGLYQEDLETELVYNKPDLANPSFIAF